MTAIIKECELSCEFLLPLALWGTPTEIYHTSTHFLTDPNIGAVNTLRHDGVWGVKFCKKSCQ